MDYIIKNYKNLYIKLNENGKPVTCPEHEKTLFEESKAKNIIKCLPKNLQRYNFRIEPIPDIVPKVNKEVVDIIKKSVINKEDYELSENISRWIERFGNCYDVFKDAKQTLNELIEESKKYDQELLDILHMIELETPKDLYNGWKMYKSIKENRKKRRIVKDEMLIIKNVLHKINPSYLKRENIQKAIDGLFERKYSFRIVEEEDEENVM